jgi:hypothetical protein
MKRILLLVLAAWFALPTAAVAVLLERDLGHGLQFYRVHELPADLPPTPAAGRTPACVVDLRYVRADADVANAFAAWLKFRATPRSPVFVLANRDTSSTLLKVIAGHERSTGIMVVGVPGRGFQPDVAVATSAENERRAYDALEQGAAITTLVTDNPDKVRNDEASLSKDRLAEASAEAADDVLTGKRPAPPVDAALQRALHLHRALVALKRI